MQRLEELPAEPQPSPAASPYQPRELVAGDLVIDTQAHLVQRGKFPISLTPTEFQLLVILARRPGEVIDYVTLVKSSLEYEAEPWEAKELIKHHVFSLRQKIEPEPSNPRYILNVRGIGYRLTSP